MKSVLSQSKTKLRARPRRLRSDPVGEPRHLRARRREGVRAEGPRVQEARRPAHPPVGRELRGRAQGAGRQEVVEVPELFDSKIAPRRGEWGHFSGNQPTYPFSHPIVSNISKN